MKLAAKTIPPQQSETGGSGTNFYEFELMTDKSEMKFNKVHS